MSRYGVGMASLWFGCFRYGFGMVLVLFWYGVAMVLVWFWHGAGMVLV